MTPINVRTILSQLNAQDYAVARKEAVDNEKHRARKEIDGDIEASEVYRRVSLRLGKASVIDIARAAGRSPSSVYSFIRNNPDFFQSEYAINRYKKKVMFYWVE